MSDLQTKLGGGINILQDSLQQGKQMLQTAQEISQLKKVVQETATKRAELIQQLGETVYRIHRDGELHNPELQELTQSIIGLDKIIFNAQKSMELQSKKNPTSYKCQCGATISENDKFCGGCGTKVEIQKEVESGPTIVCQSCEEEIPAASNFCKCCGMKVVK
ncbi:zinc ribbon domain-containing protein [Bacillus sp. FJAT-49736]|uniref:zinc ribbon domain-containing protein n=1 Tax=Bacillus sp. FJAT-49736 TaxID=2833582 RepID=UPI001BC8CA9F|nr:zinc ribbon domain-containing protein [Bacillus sp. FJAT-49736]MBS4174249.1 zinc ribbon domain-containing protein [Bacillus sp. FJAT-49736]